ncbi:ABC transporter ATP-binding protein [Natribacillus halophilus]|uniref:ABC-2 type transport system ATP-binding protein n=1 Tax=Natribacillus halophilus TaxID=549003 RepID=A0A1G8SMD9_9BACI|nr:ABC transporter ATP-binding protein [Natribacillus halophilus]SDJ29770.1 ABC-2 type transport system ATP-binding protein [Natribacillus halophilus]
MKDAITLHNVNKAFNGFALNNVSFSVKKGFITGFIGPNGSGKTTTIKLIMNIIRQDSGTLRLFGLDNEEYSKEVKQRIGFVYAENHFYEHLTVEKMKQVIAPFYTQWDDGVFAYYMDYFNLPWRKKIKHLSTGMVTKLSLAMALSHHAELIIMDEPTSGLDPIVRREILDILSEVIQDENKAIFFSTHITTDLEQIADYITFLYNGEIIFSDRKDMIKEQYYIVKGANELLDADIRTMFIQLRETSTGFEGLTVEPKKVRTMMGDYVVMESALLEDIMVYTARKDQYV